MLFRSVKASFEAAGNLAVTNESPQAFAAFVRSENRKWADIIRLTGITAAS